MTADKARVGARLRAERKQRQLTVEAVARALRDSASEQECLRLPKLVDLTRMIRGWEAGEHLIGERYRLLYARAFNLNEADLIGGQLSDQRQQAVSGLDAFDLVSWLESTNVGDATLSYLKTATERLAFDYARRPPLMVIADTIGVLGRVTALLRGGRQRLVQTQTLLEIASELMALAGLLSGDVGHYRSADTYGHAAWTCAEEADSDMARALARSAQSKTARWEERFADAADLARHGYEICPPVPERVLLAAAEATALQSHGDSDGAWQAMRRAQQARDDLAGQQEAAATAWTCPRPRQAVYALQIGLGSSDPAAALAEVQAADDAWAAGDPWVYGTWAQVRIGAALAHVMRGEPERATAELDPVFDLAPEYRVVTIIGRMTEVSRRLHEPRYTGDTAASDLRERIHEFRAGSLEHQVVVEDQ